MYVQSCTDNFDILSPLISYRFFKSAWNSFIKNPLQILQSDYIYQATSALTKSYQIHARIPVTMLIAVKVVFVISVNMFGKNNIFVPLSHMIFNLLSAIFEQPAHLPSKFKLT